MMDGYNMRSEIEMQRAAWHAAHVMNIHLKKKVTISQLLGKEKQQKQSDKDKLLEFEKLTDLLNKRRSR